MHSKIQSPRGSSERAIPWFQYCTIPSPIGELGVLWRTTRNKKLLIQRIFLPIPKQKTERRIQKKFPRVAQVTSLPFGGLKCALLKVVVGKKSVFDIKTFDFSLCTEFEKKVLRAVRLIRQGRVVAYKEIAAKVGSPQGARAVGNVMKKNLFPLVVPCHRVVSSAGVIGGFQGGCAMKRQLLEAEGIRFDVQGRIIN